MQVKMCKVDKGHLDALVVNSLLKQDTLVKQLLWAIGVEATVGYLSEFYHRFHPARGGADPECRSFLRRGL